MLPEWVPAVVVVVVAPLTLVAAFDVWRGRFRPNLVTWVLWSATPLIAAAAAIVSGAGMAAVTIVGAGVGPALVVVVALAASVKGNRPLWEVQNRDLVCGATAILALVAWALTGDPLAAALLAILADAMAALPTVVKAWRYPATEVPWAYIGGIASGLTALGVLRDWDVANWVFPLYLTLLCAVIVALSATPGRAAVAGSTEAVDL